jgi:MoxR-like ATPase
MLKKDNFVHSIFEQIKLINMDNYIDIKELNERIQRESAFVDIVNMEMKKVIVGQKHLLEGLMIGLLSDGHILLEGVPGLAKTLAINTLAKTIDAKFARVQLHPTCCGRPCWDNDLQSEKRRIHRKKRSYFRKLYSCR